MKMRHLVITCSLLLALALSAAPAAAQDAPREVPPSLDDPGILSFTIANATSDIDIDGVLDEPAWADALVVPLPYEWYPGDNVTPPVATEALLTYDSSNIYVGFRAHDPEPGAIRAHLMDRDNIRTFTQNDHVGFQFDPFNDERRAFQFRINPLGVQVDAVFSEIDQIEDFSWDAIWASAGRITADGYVVEVAVPLEQLRFPRTEDVQTWGFEAFRSYPRSVRHRISSKFTDRDKDCTLCQENKIAGFSGIRPGLNVELDPTLTVTRSDTRKDFPDGGFESGDEDFEPGIYGRWGITPNVSFSGTVNPDFSQVEADARQLDINTRFALFFPEKRPFFLEGADFYTTPLQAVFTRTVADPEWGAKLTGKEGNNAVGAFIAQDRQNNLLLPTNQGSAFAFLDDDVTSGVLRYRRDIGARSTVGVLYTGRDSAGYSNDVYGLDGFLRFDTSNAVRFQYLGSETDYPDAVAGGRQLDGAGWLLQYDHLSRNWIGTLSYTDLDPDFRADSGFIPRVDVRTAQGRLFHRWWGGSETWYNQLFLGVNAARTEDYQGIETDRRVEVVADYAGPNQSFVELTLADAQERFRGTMYSVDRQGVFFQIRPSGDLSLSLDVKGGDAIDFTNNQAADLFQIQPGIELRWGQHVNGRLDHVRQRLDVASGELFTVDLTQALLVYQFNVRAFVRAIVQYQTIDRDPAQYSVPVRAEQEDLFGQLLFSYELNPQTVLFLGYTDTRFGADAVSLTQTDRAFFFKVGYAFLF